MYLFFNFKKQKNNIALFYKFSFYFSDVTLY